MTGDEMFDDIYKRMEELFQPFLKQNCDLLKKPMELVAIWITDNPIRVNGKNHYRFTEGDSVKVADGKLVNHEEGELFTHKILATYGNIDSSRLQMMIVDINTLEVSIIEI